MTRSQLKQLSRLRIIEAKVLLDSGNFSGGYYIAGYSIECALKSCIARKIISNTIPDKRLINEIYTHDLKHLVKLAGLETNRTDWENTNLIFATNWNIVAKWSEKSRYEIYTEKQARELYDSIISKKGGILSWIQQYW